MSDALPRQPGLLAHELRGMGRLLLEGDPNRVAREPRQIARGAAQGDPAITQRSAIYGWGMAGSLFPETPCGNPVDALVVVRCRVPPKPERS